MSLMVWVCEEFVVVGLGEWGIGIWVNFGLDG